LIERTIPFLVFIFVLIAKIPTKITKKIIIYQAKQKLKKFKNLKIIGITGSFGKTSVKEFTFQILAAKYKVLKTEKNINTDIGVAETILKNLNPAHQIFIVEMGAYKQGEIKDICQITPPDISILTAISEQHQESFKSLENTIATKSEIFEYQKKGGLAIISADNYYCIQIAQRLKQRKILYSTRNKADFYAQNIKVFPNGFLFTLLIDGQKITIESKLLGRHNVSNLLPAIAVAQKFGLTLDEIKNQINKIAPIEKTMRIIPGIKNSIFIDDSYNANPDGIIAALDYLKLYPSKKIIVSSGMYELGKTAKKLYLEVGIAIGKICDLAIFTNLNHKDQLVKGFTKFGKKENIVFENNLKKVKEILNNQLAQKPVILFEGRTTDTILKDLKA
jgi:UDP-N-acetylmuramoyl-tripeptide--D-alanyl-D-alanine ligase